MCLNKHQTAISYCIEYTTLVYIYFIDGIPYYYYFTYFSNCALTSNLYKMVYDALLLSTHVCNIL